MSKATMRAPSTAYFVRRLLAYHPWPQAASGVCWILFHKLAALSGAAGEGLL